jgi:hypothetical protein
MARILKRLRKRVKRALGLRIERPPFTGKYYELGRRLLLDAIDIFNAAGLPYAVDAGTLLGLVREGDLIPWDNDLDIMLPAADVPQLTRLYPQIRARGWRVSRTYTIPFDSDAWRSGDPRVVKVRSKNPWGIGPGSTLLDITIIYPHGDYYWWEMSGRVCRIDRTFFDGREEIRYAGRPLKVPRNYEQYLTHTYGDWRTPRPDFGHDESGVIVKK